MNGRNIAPWVGCDYRTPDGKNSCRERFGGDRIGETFAEVHRRAMTSGWVKGTCDWWRGIHKGRLFDLCPTHADAADATVIRAAAKAAS